MWDMYARGLKEQFGSNTFFDPMSVLVSLKHQGSLDYFHEGFVSLVNHLQLLEVYALSIFISSLKLAVG